MRYTAGTQQPAGSGILSMDVGIRTQDLRKVYNSAPPMGAAGVFVGRADGKGSKQPKSQITALDGLSLEVNPGEIFAGGLVWV